MRYFLDTEFNGFGGALLSLALVPEDGQEFYVTLECDDPVFPWVERNVMPYLDQVPDALRLPRIGRDAAASRASTARTTKSVLGTSWRFRRPALPIICAIRSRRSWFI